MWLCMKWLDMVHSCTVYTEHAEMAAVLRGTSHVTTKQHCKYTTWVDTQNSLWKATVTHLLIYMILTDLESHAVRVQWVCWRVENSAMYIIICTSDQQHEHWVRPTLSESKVPQYLPICCGWLLVTLCWCWPAPACSAARRASGWGAPRASCSTRWRRWPTPRNRPHLSWAVASARHWSQNTSWMMWVEKQILSPQHLC